MLLEWSQVTLHYIRTALVNPKLSIQKAAVEQQHDLACRMGGAAGQLGPISGCGFSSSWSPCTTSPKQSEALPVLYNDFIRRNSRKQTFVSQGTHEKNMKKRVLSGMGCTWQSLGKSQVRLSARKGPPLKWGAFLRYPTTVTWTHFRPHMNPFQCHMKPLKWPCNPSTYKQGGSFSFPLSV